MSFWGVNLGPFWQFCESEVKPQPERVSSQAPLLNDIPVAVNMKALSALAIPMMGLPAPVIGSSHRRTSQTPRIVTKAE